MTAITEKDALTVQQLIDELEAHKAANNSGDWPVEIEGCDCEGDAGVVETRNVEPRSMEGSRWQHVACLIGRAGQRS